MADTLATISDSASDFRRTSGRDRLPVDIKRRAVALLKTHSAAEVAIAVGVSCGKVVKTWQASLASAYHDPEQRKLPIPTTELSPSEQSMSFVELPPNQSPYGGGAIEVELDCGWGRRLRLRGDLDARQLRAVVQAATCSGLNGEQP
jgi:hypothetical protein